LSQQSSGDEVLGIILIGTGMAGIMSIFSGQITSFAAFPILGFIGGALMAWGLALILRASRRNTSKP